MNYSNAQIDQAVAKARSANDTEAVAYLETLRPQNESKAEASDYGRSVLSGMSLGFADEIGAGLLAGYEHMTGRDNFSNAYKTFRDRERGELAQFRQDHPGKALATEFAGGLLTGGVGGAKAGATAAGRELLKKGVGTRMAAASGVGGLTGAVVGAGEADSIADIPGEALKAGAVGALLGPVAELGTTAVQKGYGAVKRNFADPQTRAANALRKTMEDAGDTPRIAATRADTMGDGTVLADTSEAARQRLSTLAQAPGKTRQAATEALSARSERQGDDLMAALGPAEKVKKLDQLAEVRQKQASPLYEKAFDQGVEQTDELERIFKLLERTDPGIWKKAQRTGLRKLAGKGIDIEPDALGGARPSLRGWQAMKEHLDSLEGMGKRAGGESASYGDIRRRLLRELDRQNPDYKEARALWAGTKEFEESIAEGGKILRMSSSDIQQRLKDASKADREAFRVGAVQAIFDRLENMGLTHDATKIFRTKGMERRLKALFGKDKAGFDEFMDRMNTSAAQQATYNSVTSGSRTAAHLLGDEDTLAPDVARIFSDMARGQGATNALTSAAGDLLIKAGRKAGDAVGTNRATRDELGRMLLMSPQEMQTLLPSIANPPPLPRASGAGLLAPSLLGVGGGLLMTGN